MGLVEVFSDSGPRPMAWVIMPAFFPLAAPASFANKPVGDSASRLAFAAPADEAWIRLGQARRGGNGVRHIFALGVRTGLHHFGRGDLANEPAPSVRPGRRTSACAAF